MKLFCPRSPALSWFFYGFLAGIFYLEASAAPPQSLAYSSDDAIIAVLHVQQEAWNEADIEGFMNGYLRSDETVFISGDELTRGWKTVHDRYQSKYSDRAKMGTLIFSDLQITKLSSDAALASGRWQLKRANDNPHGRFTLILRNTPDGWRIVHDHTSEAR
jgi:ketosteroid isomerase-like protein